MTMTNDAKSRLGRRTVLRGAAFGAAGLAGAALLGCGGGDTPSPSAGTTGGASGDLGKMLGLDNRWAVNIVRLVGNYGESFDANLKPLGFERGLNRLWTQGGLMYAPPIR